MYQIRFTFIFFFSLLIHCEGQIRIDFSETRGFYDTSFDLRMVASTSSATIRYTLDGEEPTPNTGTIYNGPISVSTTTVLRAIAFEVGVDTSEVYTHSYFYLQDVINQKAQIDGWPNNTYSLGAGGQAIHDYEMDPAIVNSTLYSEDIINGLKEIPTLSIVMPRSEFWEMYDGEVETKTSIELLYANDDSLNEQVDCGIEPHSHFRLKRSLRLSFKRIYGEGMWESNIFRNSILGGDSAVDKLDRIVLRAGNNRAWSRNWNEDRTAFTRDEWFRQSQIAASGIGAHGTFVHLYVNGLYWGLYNPVERPDEGFTSAYLGGEKEDWFAVSHGGDQGGNSTRFRYLRNELINKDLTDSVNYTELEAYLDIPQFADYLIVSWMTGVQDWPRNNWWGGIRNNPSGTFKYFGWDNEWSWDLTRNANNGAWVHPAFRSNATNGQESALLFNKAKVNQDFMIAFADRVYNLCFNNGGMTDENSRRRWAILNDNIKNAVVAESARWGDGLGDGETRTRDEHWQNEVDRLDSLMNGNVERFMIALLEEGYYPSLNPPVFENNEIPIEVKQISVENGYIIDLINPNLGGDIYYTLDGTDPRLTGGEISSSAVLYDDQGLIINNAIELNARINNGEEWTALHKLNVFIQNDLSKIKLTEIMYHPQDIDTLSGTELEFLEIKNTSETETIDISGLAITDGVEFSFPTGTILEPQSFLVIASNAIALMQKCPGVVVFGEYDGQLSNGGEQIEFTSFNGESVIIVDYKDNNPWPEEADGSGHSLVPSMINPEGDQNEFRLWTISENNECGSPGKDENIISSITSPSKLSSKVNIYPNPSFVNQQVIINAENRINTWEFFNEEGIAIAIRILSVQDKKIVFQPPIKAGSYIIKLNYLNGKFSSHVLIVKE